MLSFGGTQIANLPDAAATTQSGQAFVSTSNLMFISLSFGLSLIINVWIFFRVSGALFNPAISLALVVARVISPLRGGLLFIAQLVGGIAAAAIIDGLMPGQLNVGTRLSGGINTAQGNSSIEIVINYRPILGNVFDRSIGSCGFHARCGKTQIHLLGSDRNWTYSFHRTNCRGVLHRGKSQSRPKFRTRCRYRKFPLIPLDLLYIVPRRK